MPADEALAEYGQNLPYSLEAEQSVLGAILIDPEKLPDVMNDIKTPAAILHPAASGALCPDGADVQRVQAHRLCDPAGGGGTGRGLSKTSQNAKSYLLHLMELVPTTANLSHYCGIVVEKYYLRNLLGAATDIAASVREADGDATALLDAAEQKIYDIRQGRQSADLKADQRRHHRGLRRDLPDELQGLTAGTPACPRALPGWTRCFPGSTSRT